MTNFFYILYGLSILFSITFTWVIMGAGIWMCFIGISGEPSIFELGLIKINTPLPGLVVLVVGFLAFRFIFKQAGKFYHAII